LNPLLLSGFGTSISVDKRKLIIQKKLANEKLAFYPKPVSAEKDESHILLFHFHFWF